MTAEQISRPTNRLAFTLIEILVVVVIILLLIAILLPALGYAKRLANITNTTAELKAVSNSCDAYCTNLGSYPGVFSEADVSASHTSGTSLSGTQNMLLSLMGQICGTATTAKGDTAVQITVNGKSIYVNPPTFAVPNGATQSGLCAASDNSTGIYDLANASKFYSAFYGPRAQDVTASIGGMPATSYSSGSAPTLPTLIDHFPDPLPILYYRKTPGVDAPAASETPTTASAAFYRNCNAEYTDSATLTGPYGAMFNQTSGSTIAPLSSAGTDPIGTLAGMAGLGKGYVSGQSYNVGDHVGSSLGTSPTAGYLYQCVNNTNAPSGVTNGVSSGSGASSWSAVPSPSGAYLLISAGTSRLYGNTDSIIVMGGQ